MRKTEKIDDAEEIVGGGFNTRLEVGERGGAKEVKEAIDKLDKEEPPVKPEEE
jgi:hypothetical protein